MFCVEHLSLKNDDYFCISTFPTSKIICHRPSIKTTFFSNFILLIAIVEAYLLQSEGEIHKCSTRPTLNPISTRVPN